MVDLGELFNSFALTNSTLLQAPLSEFQAALNAAVVYKKNGLNKSKSTGLSIYFPIMQKDYNTQYNRLEEMNIWRELLTGYYEGKDVSITDDTSTLGSDDTNQSSGGTPTKGGVINNNASIKPKPVGDTQFFSNPDHKGSPLAAEYTILGKNVFGAKLIPENISKVASGMFFFGLKINGETILLFDSSAKNGNNIDLTTFPDNTMPMVCDIILSTNAGLFTASQGVAKSQVYLSAYSYIISQNADLSGVSALIFNVPFYYESPAKKRSLIVYREENRVKTNGWGAMEQDGASQSGYYVQSGKGWAPLFPEKGSKIYPIGKKLTGTKEEWIKIGTTAFDATKELKYEPFVIPAGADYYAMMKMTDRNGNFDYVYQAAKWITQ